jgi:hypothetical protein
LYVDRDSTIAEVARVFEFGDRRLSQVSAENISIRSVSGSSGKFRKG